MAEEQVTSAETQEPGSETFDFGLEPDTGVTETPPQDESGAGQEGQPGKGEVVAPAAPAWEFEYQGRKFTSPEEANQYFRTWDGRIQASDRRAVEIERMNSDWQGWYEENKSLIEEAKKLKEARSKVTPGEAGISAIDWKQVEQMFKQGRSLEAMQYMQYENSRFIDKQLQSIKEELQGSIAPLTESRDEQIFVTELMRAAHNATDPVSGNYIYPEFNEQSGQYNSELVQTFGAIYAQLPKHLRFDPDGYGVDLAYHRAKAIVGGRTASAAPGTDGPAPAPTESEIAAKAREQARDAMGRFTKGNETAAEGTGGSPGTDTSKGGAYSEAMLKQKIKGSVEFDPVFGISR